MQPHLNFSFLSNHSFQHKKMEQIRRSNRMYTSDSLFCKSVLSIPVPAEQPDSGRVTKSSTSNTINDPEEIQVIVEDPHQTNCGANNKRKSKGKVHSHNNCITKSTSSQQHHNQQPDSVQDSVQNPVQESYLQGMSRSQSEFSSWTSVTSSVGRPADSMSISSDPSSISLSTLNGSRNSSTRTSRNSIKRMDPDAIEPLKEETASDFLSRIDSSIKKTKDQVAKNQKSLVPYSQSENDLFSLDPGPSTSSRIRKNDNGWRKTYVSMDGSTTNGSPTASSSEVPACYIKAKEHKVRYSMRRLEQQQDELFQL